MPARRAGIMIPIETVLPLAGVLRWHRRSAIQTISPRIRTSNPRRRHGRTSSGPDLRDRLLLAGLGARAPRPRVVLRPTRRRPRVPPDQSRARSHPRCDRRRTTSAAAACAITSRAPTTSGSIEHALHGAETFAAPDIRMRSLSGRRLTCSMSLCADRGRHIVAGVSRTSPGLAEERRQRDLFFQNAFDMVCLVNTDGTIRSVNPSFERVLGYDAGELAGRDDPRLPPPGGPVRDGVHDAPHVARRAHGLLRQPVPVPGRDVEGTRVDGDARPRFGRDLRHRARRERAQEDGPRRTGAAGEPGRAARRARHPATPASRPIRHGSRASTSAARATRSRKSAATTTTSSSWMRAGWRS